MKHIKLLMSLFFTAIITQAFAQTDKQTTAKIIEEKNYVFVANTAIPMANMDVMRVLQSMPGNTGSSMINLSGSQYDLTVTKDSIIAYLPYYGRAFNAVPYNPTEGGIKFTSKDFTYKESKGKKGAYTVSINTKDVKQENYRMTLNVSVNGYASLVVTGFNKQPITFNGQLAEPKVKK